MFRHCNRRGERIGPADGTRSQAETGVRSPVCPDWIGVRHIAGADEEQRASENGGMTNVRITPEMMREMIGVQ